MSALLSKLVRITLIVAFIYCGFGNVLCYGSDGHVAMESMFHDHCQHQEHGDDTQSPKQEQKYIDALEGCNPCVDIIISTDIVPVQTQSPVFYSSTALYAIDPIELDINIHIQRVNHSSFFKPLKTIILLT